VQNPCDGRAYHISSSPSSGGAGHERTPLVRSARRSHCIMRGVGADLRYIPKEGGSKHPLADAALEDKIVQRAVAAVLSAIYEEEFLGFSYGFRPGRSQHDALDALIVGISNKKVNFILDADIRSFSRKFPRNGSSASWNIGSAIGASSGSSRNGCGPASWKTGW
jgi:hypothetical protein